MLLAHPSQRYFSLPDILGKLLAKNKLTVYKRKSTNQQLWAVNKGHVTFSEITVWTGTSTSKFALYKGTAPANWNLHATLFHRGYNNYNIQLNQ